jgi:hypothetical protein
MLRLTDHTANFENSLTMRTIGKEASAHEFRLSDEGPLGHLS